MTALRARPGQRPHAGVPLVAPILIVPRILEPTFCQALMEAYEREGGQASGVMREVNGKTVGVLNDFKRRRDAVLPEGAAAHRPERPGPEPPRP